MNLRLQPIDVKKDGTPIDPELFAAVVKYGKEQFGEKYEFNVSFYSRCWAVIAVKPEDPSFWQVTGLCGTRNTIDVPLFHVTPLTQDREGLKWCETARDAMIYRMRSYIQDLGIRGTALIFVAPVAERLWRRFLIKLGAKPACRYEIGI
jgi:hypothetical protein